MSPSNSIPEKNQDFEADVARIQEIFSARIAKYGDTPQSAEHLDRATQEKRMDLIAEVAPLEDAKILDFGCATGHLLTFLRERHGFAGEYVGYDITQEMIDIAAAKFPDARFECRNILEEGVPEDFDYVFISGTFNDLTPHNWNLMQSALKALYPRTRKAIAFNNLTTYVDYFDDHLFYVSPEQVFRFCKEELSPCVTLRHDYQVKEGSMPYEFTTYVYRSEFDPRKNLDLASSR